MDPEISSHQLDTADGPRHYLVARPPGSAGQRLPAILLLHGHGQSGAYMLGQAPFFGYRTRIWAQLAARERVLLIAPDGTPASDGRRAWNDCRADAQTNAPTDDVAFLGALLDRAIDAEGADPQRIYAFGSSNGGGMVYRLAIEIGARLAAIATQSAVLPAHSRCAAPSHPLPVLLTHGTADPITPYAGGAISAPGMQGRGTGIGVEATAEVWRTLAGLPPAPVTERIARRYPGNATAVVRLTWGRQDGPQVVLLRVEGGGHTAPAGDEVLPNMLRQLVGEQNRDVDLAAEAWTFFQGRRRQT
ncbi:polyhydroxybutyrate depolymerase [Pseudoduganella flava]|uniref:Alpha/beta hydrolase fold domain-containing protein n=1 Tax=Pseudoduganella flava TaxID=871742 RepID=A0A562PLQ7_9BURK|nr:PHB depolymerase family esterase [Pseudoduganella flava]QGZ41047.1 alpha/beta hydrolase fold domain-containing protein [Pseudoduganella flava]TWI45253.1 polyhydroxybutyrate depolymerase [Pseudoduganella flava]